MATLLPEGKQSFTTSAGVPLVGGKLYTYDAGTSMPRVTYSDSAGTVPNTNPVILDARGEATIFWTGTYKVVLKDALDNTIWTVDGVSGVSGADLSSSAGSGLVGFLYGAVYAAGTVGKWLQDLAASAGSTFVGFIQSGVGAVLRTSQAKLRERVSPEDFGATGDGVTDDTAALTAAVAAVASGGVIRFMFGKTYKTSGVNVNGKAVTLEGYGATLNCTGGTGALIKTDHGNKLTVKGLTFTGSGSGINHTAAASGTVYDELLIEDCTFNVSAGAYGVYSIGSREARIVKCTFLDANGGSGLYFSQSVSPFVDKCIFKGQSYTTRGLHYPGTGTAYDAGLVLRDTEIMGWDKGLEVVGCDWLTIEGCTIDYCNWSVKIASQDGANISNNYIGSLGANPALWLTADAAASSPNYDDKISVVNNTFTGHYTGGNTYDCILIDGAVTPDNISICNNNIHFFTRYGVQFTTTARLRIEENNFGQRPGFGVSPIYNSTGANDSGVSIKRNYFSNGATIAGMNVGAFGACNENIGCVTEARGEAFVGSGVSTYNQAHGCAYTPAKSDVVLTPTNSEAAGKNPYISSVDATNIVIGFTAATAATAGVQWRVRRGT